MQGGLVSNPSTCPIALGSTLEVSMAADLYQRLSQALEEEDTLIVLDGSDVERVDAAGLQLLLAFVREAEARQAKWHWEAVPAVLSSAAHRLGLAQALQLETAAG